MLQQISLQNIKNNNIFLIFIYLTKTLTRCNNLLYSCHADILNDQKGQQRLEQYLLLPDTIIAVIWFQVGPAQFENSSIVRYVKYYTLFCNERLHSTL